jgi:two-component system, NarL family, nitrate/nitrite response regulator NarL
VRTVGPLSAKRTTGSTRPVTVWNYLGVIRLAIVDDHPLARRGVESVLAGIEDLTVTASVATVAELPDPRALDLVILDLYLADGVPCTDAVRALRPHTRVLVLSASRVPADVVAVIRAGANGYLTKSAEPEMLVSSVQTVATGGFALSAELADILQAELAAPAPSGTAPAKKPGKAAELSPREREALSYIARGYTHAQTATRMAVTKATVDTYVERIRAKLQLGNKAELTRAAIDLLGGADR